MKEIDRKNPTKVNATRGNVYTIHTNKYIEHVPSKPTATSMREKGIDKCANAQATIYAECRSNNVVAIESSRRREHESSTTRTFVRQFVLDHKKARQSRQPVSKN